MRFSAVEWDDANWPKCGRHGTEKQEIEQPIRSSGFRFFPDPLHSDDEDRWIGIGRGPTTGRWTLVVFTFRDEERSPKARPISARYMHAKEIRKYVHETSSKGKRLPTLRNGFQQWT